MRYTFQTAYNQKALTAMARSLRKTVRAKRSKRSHVFGWIVIVLALLLSFSSGEEGFTVTFRTVITWIAAAVMLLVLLFEDPINGCFAGKRMLKGTECVTATFDADEPDVFFSETQVGRSEFSYEKVVLVAETDRYFVFAFSTNHAQVYDKSTLSGGTVDAFRAFIAEKVGKAVLPIK